MLTTAQSVSALTENGASGPYRNYSALLDLSIVLKDASRLVCSATLRCDATKGTYPVNIRLEHLWKRWSGCG